MNNDKPKADIVDITQHILLNKLELLNTKLDMLYGMLLEYQAMLEDLEDEE